MKIWGRSGNCGMGKINQRGKNGTPLIFPHENMDLPQFKENQAKHAAADQVAGVYSHLLIQVQSDIIGTIVYYWENESTRWLEIGITIYKPEYWNGGYGTEALKLYIDYLFHNLEIERVGLTTWSGNERMIAAAKKVGMQMEGRMRKCRYYDGYYYDSIRMGTIREEWNETKKNRLN